MAQDTLLGFPAHTLPYRRGKLMIKNERHPSRASFVTIFLPGA